MGRGGKQKNEKHPSPGVVDEFEEGAGAEGREAPETPADDTAAPGGEGSLDGKTLEDAFGEKSAAPAKAGTVKERRALRQAAKKAQISKGESK